MYPEIILIIDRVESNIEIPEELCKISEFGSLSTTLAINSIGNPSLSIEAQIIANDASKKIKDEIKKFIHTLKIRTRQEIFLRKEEDLNGAEVYTVVVLPKYDSVIQKAGILK